MNRSNCSDSMNRSHCSLLALFGQYEPFTLFAVRTVRCSHCSLFAQCEVIVLFVVPTGRGESGNLCYQARTFFSNCVTQETYAKNDSWETWMAANVRLILTVFCVINAAWSPRAMIQLKTKIHGRRIIAGDSSISGLIYRDFLYFQSLNKPSDNKQR